MNLKNKVVIITGASRGIGRALAKELGREGCQLLLTALEKDELNTLTIDLKAEYGIAVDSIAVNLTDVTERGAFADWIKTSNVQPDILINNAGAGQYGNFDASSETSIEQSIKLNILAPVYLIREMIPVLSKSHHARIVNISSAISRLPYPGFAIYGASKGFISSFSETLACELSESNIKILCFHPGFTKTNFMSSARMNISQIPNFLISSPEKVATRIIKAIKKDKGWAYADFYGWFGAFTASMMPYKLRMKIYNKLFRRIKYEA